MKINRSTWIGVSAVLLALFVLCAAPACDDDDDDNDNDDDDDTGAPEHIEPADCVPDSALVSAFDRANAIELLELYLGEYRDENGRTRVIECNPDGSWSWPPEYDADAGITYDYILPVFIFLKDEPAVVDARLGTQFSPPEVTAERPVTDWPGYLNFLFEDAEASYVRVTERDETPLRWQADDSPVGLTWTKLED